MDLNLNDDVVFVAGASRGVGRAIAAEVLAEGARVVLTGRDVTSLQQAHADLEAAYGGERVLSIAGDLLDHAVIDGAFNQAVERFGRIDHLVANIGTGKGERGWDLPDAEWQRLFDINFFGSARLTQAALPHILANPRGGSVLFISSIVAIEATPAPLPYSAAKAALINYSKNLARALASNGVRVNTIAPGNIFFEGGSWHERSVAEPDQVRAMLDAEVPLRRFGSPEEIARLAAFLCSPASGFTTGSCFVVDGGQTRRI
ncbi:MAG: SDR family NAD(P)-dependent oxidoreductase [Candidatus Nanopelagicales bacterium]